LKDKRVPLAKNKNQRIWSNDPAVLKGIADEQRDYIGRDFELDLKNGLITIFALPRKYKAKRETPPKVERNKRSEKFERRS
jgi:hypothetical protein